MADKNSENLKEIKKETEEAIKILEKLDENKVQRILGFSEGLKAQNTEKRT